MTTHQPRRPILAPAGLLVLALVATACGSGPATPSPAPTSAAPTSPAQTMSPSPAGSMAPATSGPPPTPDVGALTQTVGGQVTAIRGLTQQVPVQTKIVDAAAMTAIIEADFDEENPAAELAADERLAKVLGLLPGDASLADLYERLLTSQVVGLYSSDDKTLYVLQTGTGRLGPSERMIFAHEYTHALQDQAFDLEAYGEVLSDPHQGDRALARLGLVEGDASLVMTVWAQSNLTVEELLQAAREAADPAASAIMAAMPAYLRETALFPYSAGLSFATAVRARGGWAAVDAAYASPPETTEQVLHPEKYASREPAAAVSISETLAGRMGPGWSIGTTDTLGEFVLRIWLREGGISPGSALTAAAGWGGDRVALLDGPDGARGAVLASKWDSLTDAREFADQARTAIGSLGINAVVIHQPASTGVTVVVGSDDAVTDRLYGLLGVAGV